MLSKDGNSLDEYAFLKSINLIDTMQTQVIYEKNFFAGVSYLKSAPLEGPRIYENESYSCLFAGDLIGYDEIPWVEIIKNFNESNTQWFSSLRGIYAFAIYNKKEEILSAISDNLAFLPIYYGFIDNDFIFSTSIATFATLKSVPDFNVEWLFEYFYFNFPIDSTTCLKGVERLRSNSMLTIDIKSKTVKNIKFREILKKSDKILTGKEAYELGYKTFNERLTKYLSCDNNNFMALTGGFDSRTLISLAPKIDKIICYTYGVPGSNDLFVANKLKNELKLNHKSIFFDTDFEASLPDLIYDSVRLSGGVQSILRATLPFVYKVLNNDLKHNESSVVIGGVGGDLFRGAPGSADSSLSAGMVDFYRTGKVTVNNTIFKDIFRNNWHEFENHIENTLIKIKELYGDPLNPETAMSYDNYEINPKYFGGELAIASNYLTLRFPYLDTDILKFAFKSEFSNLGLSPYIHSKKYLWPKKYFFQSKLICSNNSFKKTFINGLPIKLYTYNNKFLFQISRLFIRGYYRLTGKEKAHDRLEDWKNWCQNILSIEFEELLNDSSHILKYFDKELIDAAKATNNIQLLNKLVSTEILLDLLKNRWDIKNEY